MSRREHALQTQSPLPPEYRQLEYLESTGTQYIKTGVSGNNTNFRIVLDIAWVDYSTWQTLGFGMSNNGLVTRIGVSGGASSTLFYTAQTSGTWVTNTCASADTSRHIFDLQSGSQKFDNNELSTRSVTGWPIEFYLFAADQYWTSGRVATYCKCRIYSCEIYKNGILFRNFIPALRIADSKLGLYDLVNDQFYINSGTGEFLYN